MKEEFERTKVLLDKIKTRVHPLNEEMCIAVRKSMKEAEVNEIIFNEQERPRKQIQFLNLNTLMLPLIPENPSYKTGY